MQIIKAKKFILRPLKQGDLLNLYKNINNKKIIFNLLSVPWPLKLKDERAWLKKTINENRKKKPENMVWAIDINGEVIGSVGFHNIKEKHKAEIGYWLAEKYWGQGIMSEAIKSATEYGFKKLRLQRIDGFVFAHNKGSKRVLEKCGYKKEAFLRKYAKARGKIIDCYFFTKM